MCLGEVAQIATIDDDRAVVRTVGGERSASLAVLSASGVDVAVGDWIVVSMGFALHTIDRPAAEAIVRDAALISGVERPDDVFGQVFL